MCKQLFIFYALFLITTSCNRRAETLPSNSSVTFASINPLLSAGTNPWAIYINGTYYYTQDNEDRISLWKTTDITDLKSAEKKEIWLPKDNNNAHHLWAPELHYLNNKWYVYFSADNGNTDNHQIYVIENASPDPLQGKFVMKGRIATDADSNWAIRAGLKPKINAFTSP